jgi:pyruvate ferredoxin oxidoreductase delta subunit
MKLTVGAVVKGRTSLSYKTGNWRDQRPVIRMEDCKRCGICVEVCPDSAVLALEAKGQDKPDYVIDYEYCKGLRALRP